MSYLLSYAQYAIPLNSDDYDAVKEAYQQLFEFLVKGYSLRRSDIKVLKNRIKIHVKSASQKVRKWSCHCACFYQDEDILKNILRQLQSENDIETIIWELTALSVKYDTVERLKRCTGRRHDEFLVTISSNYLTDALYLFGGIVNLNPGTILMGNNSSDLAALTKIYAYRSLTNNKYPTLNQEHISDMIDHEDPYVREYAYWALLRGGTNETYLDEPDDLEVSVRKHQIALQIKNGDLDFIFSALKPLSRCPQTVHHEIKIGILTGLRYLSYIEKIVPLMGGWFTRENDISVLYQITDYIFSHIKENRTDGTYFDILKDALDDSELAEYVVSKIQSDNNSDLIIKEDNSEYILDYRKKDGINMKTIVTGDNNNIAQSMDHSNSIISVSDGDSSELKKLIKNVRDNLGDLSEDDKIKVNEAMDFVESESISEKPKKTVIKTVLEGLKTIKGSIEFCAAIATLVQFFS